MSVKGQEWNGGGMALLSKERRKEIGLKMSEKTKANKTGWPKPVASLHHPAYYEITNSEFNRRVAVSKARRGIVDNSDDKLEW